MPYTVGILPLWFGTLPDSAMVNMESWKLLRLPEFPAHAKGTRNFLVPVCWQAGVGSVCSGLEFPVGEFRRTEFTCLRVNG